MDCTQCKVSKHSSIKITAASQGILGKNLFGISWCLSSEILSTVATCRIQDLWSSASETEETSEDLFLLHNKVYL